MEDHKEIVNIYLNGNNKEKIFCGTSPQEQYIIIMNEILQMENMKLKSSIKDLEHKNEELENDSDKAETSKIYMIGILKNFVEIDKLRMEIVEENNNINKTYKSYINIVQCKARQHLRYLQAFLIILFSVIWEFEFYNVKQFLSTLFIIIFMLTFIERLIHYIILPSCESQEIKIKNKMTEVKKITDAQDYLHEYIDNL